MVLAMLIGIVCTIGAAIYILVLLRALFGLMPDVRDVVEEEPAGSPSFRYEEKSVTAKMDTDSTAQSGASPPKPVDADVKKQGGSSGVMLEECSDHDDGWVAVQGDDVVEGCPKCEA